MNKPAPILKWAGGKRQLLPKIVPLIPDDYNRYFEPFLGAGAVLFDVLPKRAVVNDTNSELINVYFNIKEHPEELISILKWYKSKHTKDFYYRTRNIDRDKKSFEKMSPVEKAARTIYLNRTCYNGLYRVNRSGCFNTPIGRNTSIQIVNEDGIKYISNYLQKADIKILNEDYQTALKGIRKTDFVFLDPPYYPTNSDYFLRYDMNPFGVEAQIQLKKFCDGLTARGVRFIQTNSNCKELCELYSDYNLIEVDVRRCINAKPDGRTGTEIIILNY